MAEYEEQTASSKLSSFIEKNRKNIITVFVILVCLLAGYIVFAALNNKAKEKNLQALDEITYELTSKSSDLEDSEVEARIATAIEKAAPIAKKGGIAGARANMLCAELAFKQEKYDEAAAYWKAAASKSKKTYLAPIAYFNLAVCYENLGNNDLAVENYKLAANDESFVMRTHAMFSYGRLLETKGDFSAAAEVYTELNDKFAGNSWANLAKTRLISLQNEGKIE